MTFTVKAAVGAPLAVGPTVTVVDKAMYGRWDVTAGASIYVSDLDHHGRAGLCARGVITSVEHAPEHRWKVQIRIRRAWPETDSADRTRRAPVSGADSRR